MILHLPRDEDNYILNKSDASAKPKSSKAQKQGSCADPLCARSFTSSALQSSNIAFPVSYKIKSRHDRAGKIAKWQDCHACCSPATLTRAPFVRRRPSPGPDALEEFRGSTRTESAESLSVAKLPSTICSSFLLRRGSSTIKRIFDQRNSRCTKEHPPLVVYLSGNSHGMQSWHETNQPHLQKARKSTPLKPSTHSSQPTLPSSRRFVCSQRTLILVLSP